DIHGCHDEPTEPSGLYLCSRNPSFVSSDAQNWKKRRVISGYPACVIAAVTIAPSRGHMYVYVSRPNCTMSESVAAITAPLLSICVRMMSSERRYNRCTAADNWFCPPSSQRCTQRCQ